jgi:hypothetical protein
MKAAARVIYRGSWETERPAIMKRYGWETSNSEVLISTPRRFGKTFSCAKRAQQATTHAHTHTHTHTRARADRVLSLGSIAIFCACLALAFGLEIGAPPATPELALPLRSLTLRHPFRSRLLARASRQSQAARADR